VSAAELRARYELKTPDALHVATALEAGITGHHSEALTSAEALVIGRKGAAGDVRLSKRPSIKIVVSSGAWIRMLSPWSTSMKWTRRQLVG
jgi:hypothetical protein